MAKNFWQDKNVLVTGGSGFLGQHLVKRLQEKGCNPIVPSSKDYDLRFLSYISAMLGARKIDILFHLAARVGGIGYNQKYPYDLFYDNILMGINLINASIVKQVGKFVQIGTTCSYPKHCPVPFHERNFWNGYPEETNAPYGLAKKMLLVQLQAARQQYGFNGIYLVPTNLYGPGDKFEDYKSHVIPALIKKIIKAQENDEPSVEVWGTGGASRDFLYVEDAAKAIVLAAEKYNEPEPLNLGSGEFFRIAALVNMIKQAVGYKGETVWDVTKPDGQPKRLLNSGAAYDALGWKAEIGLREGLEKTIEWYKENYAKS